MGEDVIERGDRVSWQAQHINKRLFGVVAGIIDGPGDRLQYRVKTRGGAHLTIEDKRITKECM
jgi:hypothetical protein